jgi:acetyl-CoA C-acetyltransferase
VTREDTDLFGVRSQNLAEKAVADGFFAAEITPVSLPDGTVVDADDCPRAGVRYEAVARLEPVFRPDGTVTAGNCCPLNDGAAALVVMSDTRARDLGSRRWPASCPPVSARCPRRSWASARSRPPGRRWPGPA